MNFVQIFVDIARMIQWKKFGSFFNTREGTFQWHSFEVLEVLFAFFVFPSNASNDRRWWCLIKKRSSVFPSDIWYHWIVQTGKTPLRWCFQRFQDTKISFMINYVNPYELWLAFVTSHHNTVENSLHQRIFPTLFPNFPRLWIKVAAFFVSWLSFPLNDDY